MQLVCPRCSRILEYSGERPSFCAYCGYALGTQPVAAATAAWTPSEQTAPIDLAATTDYIPQAVAPGRPLAEAPRAVAGYRLVRELGRGGMGKVYEAEEVATGRRVALKLIAAEFAASPQAVERFRQEGQLASRIAHPRCVFVLAADLEAGQPYIVMERMPGTTLQDVVQQEGPLPTHEAVARILDVIEGLEEAHRLGVIHRDVKPSNCFLDTNGRVKVGDFGLAKALAQDAHLTQSGVFVGTPLFASPEQIRRDPLDQQTDVYSVAATLYYLLTGRAPFESPDAAATVARIVSEAPPSLRSLRPEIPPGLDRAVLRGLERRRERRWRSLAEFREALLPFLPGSLSVGGMGARFAAFLIDFFLMSLIRAPLFFVILYVSGEAGDPSAAARPEVVLIAAAVWVLYFGLPEGLWGATPAKWLLRLRVRTTGGDQPGLPRALLRAAVFSALLSLGGLAAWAYAWIRSPQHLVPPHESAADVWLATGLPLLGLVLGWGALFGSMRSRNGYRGLHEWLSGTRVVLLPWHYRQRAFPSRPLDEGLAHPVDLPAQLGPFRTEGAICWRSSEKILLGAEASLGREVWLWLRPPSGAPLGPARRDTSRATRPRWLGCGRDGELNWDAFIATVGSPLPELIQREGRLSWPDARPLLEQLTEELAAAQEDGTVPEVLGVDQVWVLPNGCVQLLDFPLSDGAEEPAPRAVVLAEPAAPASSRGEKDSVPPASDRPCLVPFLARAARLLLEGKSAPPATRGGVRAPLPGYAAKLLQRLFRPGPSYDVHAFQADLRATRDQPPEVTAPRRAAHLALLGLLLLPGLLLLFAAGWVADIATPLIASVEIHEGQRARQVLQAGAARDFILTQAAAGPFAGLRAQVQLDQDEQRDEQLGRKLDQLAQQRDAHLQSLTWYSRAHVTWTTKMALNSLEDLEGRAPAHGLAAVGPDFRKRTQSAGGVGAATAHGQLFFSGLLPCLFVFWPAVWVVWALVARGGLSYRLLGLALLRSDGRPAWRLQCAWRALLVWLPVAALLLLSAWLDAAYWRAWPGQGALAAWLWLSWLAWWAAAALLAVYTTLALWQPGRSLHDRLAGTYLVPR